MQHFQVKLCHKTELNYMASMIRQDEELAQINIKKGILVHA